jgi:hypothetical protein
MSGGRPPNGPPGAAETWRRAAEALPALDLPADRRRRPGAAAAAGRVERRLAAAAAASPEEALAAWAALLGRVTGAGRFGLAASLAGADAVLVEAAVEGDPSLADLALRLAAAVADTQRPRMPWRALAASPCGGEPGEAPPVRVAFRAGAGRKESRAVGGEWVEDSPAGFDLVLTWRAGGAAALSYAPDLFDAETAARLLARFEALLAAARSDPSTPLRVCFQIGKRTPAHAT